MKNELLNLPEIIRNERLELIRLTDAVEDINTRIKKWEAAYMDNISNVMKDGKPVFSNAEKRQAELIRRKEENCEMVDMEKGLRRDKANLEFFRIELQYKIDIQENYRAIARLGGNEL